MSIPVATIQQQAIQQRQLLEAIRKDDAVLIEQLVKRGAPLYAHYHHPEFADPALEPHIRDAALVNPVDWAALENRPRAAMQLLELGSGMRCGSEARPRPQALTEHGLAAATQVAVVKAAQHGHLGLLKMLLERGASVAQRSSQGASALHVAVSCGRADAVSYLLQHGAWDPEERRIEVLQLAEQRGMSVKFAEVLSMGGVAASVCGGSVSLEGKPLMDTARTTTPSTRPGTQSSAAAGSTSPGRDAPSSGKEVRLLLPPRALECRDGHVAGGYASWGWSPLGSLPLSPLAAASGGAVSLAKPVLSAVADHELDAAAGRLRGELQAAIRKGDVQKLRGLVERGAPLEAMFDLGYGAKGNCVDWACTCSQPEVALLLLELADLRGFGQLLAQEALAAFFWAASQGYVQVLDELLQRGADVGRLSPAKDRDEHDTALRVAVVGSQQDAVAALLRHGAWDSEIPDSRPKLLALASRRRFIAEAFRDARICSFDAQLAPLQLPYREHGIWSPDYPLAAPPHWEQDFKGTENGGV